MTTCDVYFIILFVRVCVGWGDRKVAGRGEFDRVEGGRGVIGWSSGTVLIQDDYQNNGRIAEFRNLILNVER